MKCSRMKNLQALAGKLDLGHWRLAEPPSAQAVASSVATIRASRGVFSCASEIERELALPCCHISALRVHHGPFTVALES